MRRTAGGRIDAGVLLLLTPVMWGATFPGAKLALRYLPPFAFMAWTRILGALSILVLIPLIRRTAGGGEGRTGRDRRGWPARRSDQCGARRSGRGHLGEFEFGADPRPFRRAEL